MLLKIVGLFAMLACATAQKVPVNVYYEALCPDSQAFITQQVYPVMKGPLGKFIDLKLIPYGKSNYTTIGSDVQFTCHHGPNECYGNKVQSCAIEHIQVNSYQNEYTRESLILEYINCLMKIGNNFADSIYPGKKCSREINPNQVINWDNIEQCANSTEGSKLLQKNGELTAGLNPALTSVPTVTFRHQYESETQALAMSNFAIALCKKLSAPLPQECSSHSGASINVVTSSIVLTLFAFLSKLF